MDLKNIQDLDKEARHYTQIKAKVEDGEYFKDALDWYFFRYLTPICDRTLLILSGAIFTIIILLIIEMIENTYPLVETFPIFYEAKDQANYNTKLIQLKTARISNDFIEEDRQLSVDESVAKYLISHYIKEREGFNFKTAEISDVNTKLSKMQNLSSAQEYKNFLAFIDRSNSLSPLNFFGQNVEKRIEIESFNYIRKSPKNLAEKAKEYIATSMPSRAEVKFSAETIKVNVETGETVRKKELFLVKIGFFFAGIDKDNVGNLEFIVNDYQLFRVK